MRRIALLLSAVGVGIGGVFFACGSSTPALPDLPRNDASVQDVVQGETSTGGDGSVAGSVEEFCKGTLGAYAGLLDKCCTAADKARPEGMAIINQARTIEANCITALKDGMGKSRTMYQQGQAQACLMAYAAKFADLTLCMAPGVQLIDPAVEPDPQCAVAFVGLGADNAQCSADHECKDGLTCVGYSATNDGTCRQPAAAGGMCGTKRTDGTLGVLVIPMGNHPACAAGNYCDTTGTCKAQIATGSCTRDDMCLAPGYCGDDPVTPGARMCFSGVRPVKGAGCHGTHDCPSDLWCRNADGGIYPAPPSEAAQCADKLAAPLECAFAPPGLGECSGVCPSAPPNAGLCVSLCGSQ